MAEIVHEQKFPKQPGTVPYSIVLRRMEGHHPYATHCRNDDDGGFFWGHYFKDDDLQAAQADFRKRVLQAAKDCHNCGVEVPYTELQRWNIFGVDVWSKFS